MRIVDNDQLMLSSFRCDFDDTAQYRVSAMNSKGELSAFASVVVKSRCHQHSKPSNPNALETNKLSNHNKKAVIVTHYKSVPSVCKVSKCGFKGFLGNSINCNKCNLSCKYHKKMPYLYLKHGICKPVCNFSYDLDILSL